VLKSLVPSQEGHQSEKAEKIVAKPLLTIEIQKSTNETGKQGENSCCGGGKGAVTVCG